MNEFTETTVVFKAADGSRFLRGLRGTPTDEQVAEMASALGAVDHYTLGVLTGPAGTKVTEIDYAPDGSRLRSVTRLIEEI